MDFELHLERHDGTEYVVKFRRKTLAEAWTHAVSFMGEFKCVIKMVNKSAEWEIQLRGPRD